MAMVSVSLIALALTWAGTHQIGLSHRAASFSLIHWVLAIGLLIAGGFLFTSLVIHVDIRKRFDAFTFVAIGGVPAAVLAYATYAEVAGSMRVLDKLLGWATPYGVVAMGVLVGFALAAAVQVRPQYPVVTAENLSALSLND